MHKGTNSCQILIFYFFFAHKGSSYLYLMDRSLAYLTHSLISMKCCETYSLFLRIPFSLSSFVMILKMCFISCTKMPVRPTYEGHFDLTTIGEKIKEREREVPPYTQNTNNKWEIWIHCHKPKMCAFVCRRF